MPLKLNGETIPIGESRFWTVGEELAGGKLLTRIFKFISCESGGQIEITGIVGEKSIVHNPIIVRENEKRIFGPVGFGKEIRGI